MDASAFSAAVPKNEVQDYMECDEGGVQGTSDGKEKMIDILEGRCGRGIVDTSKVVKAEEDGTIISLNKRKLKINTEWKNPSGDWHIGMKTAFDLFFENNGSDQNELSKEGKKQLAEMEDSLKMAPSGGMIHFVVWNSGEDWRAALDFVELYPENKQAANIGELQFFTPLADFRKHGKKYTGFLFGCSFGINIHNQGNAVEIVLEENLKMISQVNFKITDLCEISMERVLGFILDDPKIQLQEKLKIKLVCKDWKKIVQNRIFVPYKLEKYYIDYYRKNFQNIKTIHFSSFEQKIVEGTNQNKEITNLNQQIYEIIAFFSEIEKPCNRF